MRTIVLTALLTFSLGTPAVADGTVPDDYQGVWAAARDCKDNMQNVLSNVVNREFAVCRVMQVLSSSRPDSDASAVSLDCGGSQSREIWHSEQIDGADYLVIVRNEKGAEAKKALIDIYKRCPQIPLAEIRLSDIPGNPVAEAAPAEKVSPPPRLAQHARQRPHSRSRATHQRRRAHQ